MDASGGGTASGVRGASPPGPGSGRSSVALRFPPNLGLTSRFSVGLMALV